MSKAIEILNFSYKYPDGTPALRDVSISIEQGQKVALTGPNGAGKSTLLLAMAGFVKGSGKVFVEGLEVTSGNHKKVRSILGCCFENPDDQLFMPTVFDDVAFGPANLGLAGEQLKRRVTSALETVGLTQMADKAPHHLSAGQKRAAAIATVLAMEPKIIILDEPDGSLDARNRNSLAELLGGLSQTLVVGTCNMDFAARIATRAIIIDGGRIVADGEAEGILSDSKVMNEHGLEVPARFLLNSALSSDKKAPAGF